MRPSLPALMSLTAALVGAAPAMAARPFMTDDARLATEGSCQLESWSRDYSNRHEFWALPACNPGGNFEITAGAGRFRSDGQPGSQDQILQAKTLFRNLKPNDWAWGLALGRVWHPSAQPGPNNLGGTYLYLPVSVSTGTTRWSFMPTSAGCVTARPASIRPPGVPVWSTGHMRVSC